MTTLYKPVLIETVEQAEALPLGTISFDMPRGGCIPEASVKSAAGSWTGTLDGGKPYQAPQMVGDYALVPIEAEEEGGSEWIGPDGDFYEAQDRPRLTRLVTPWERT